MIISSKKSQVNTIKEYIEANNDKFSKCIIFGRCITKEGNPTDYLDVAVETVDKAMAEDDEQLLDLYSFIAKVTDGLFDIIIINSDQYRDLKSEYENGEVIYTLV